jgi:hypothetical protein
MSLPTTVLTLAGFLDPDFWVEGDSPDSAVTWGDGLEGKITAREQVPRSRWYVKALDKALSGWPGGPKYAWILIPCDTREDADRSAAICKSREEMRSIRVFKIATQDEIDRTRAMMERAAEEDNARGSGSLIRGLCIAMTYDTEFTDLLFGLGSPHHHYTLMTKDRCPYWHGLES